jgi:hypothetical protein
VTEIAKTVLVPARNTRGAATVRLSDEELHRAARKGLDGAEHEVFGLLPVTVAQIIQHKVWRSYGHKEFASYALDTSSNGLGVNTNQRLWLLRCSMDVQGEHVKEWADVLAKVEEMVRVWAKAEGKRVGGSGGDFDGKTLESLAKNGGGGTPAGQITYLPSRAKSHDGYLLALRKRAPEMFRKVAAGEITSAEARRSAGMRVGHHSSLGKAKSLVRNMTAKERREFIEWLREEGYL